MEKLTDPQIEAALASVGPSWRRHGETIVAERECPDFAAAITLVNRIAAAAELAEHHPDLLLHGYRWLTITLTTHAAGGLTQRDFALAAELDSL